MFLNVVYFYINLMFSGQNKHGMFENISVIKFPDLLCLFVYLSRRTITNQIAYALLYITNQTSYSIFNSENPLA